MARHPNSSTDEILVNTLRLLAEFDIPRVSIDMIAEISRVSKATIYRRWKSREDLIVQALSYLKVPVDIPDTGNIKSDLIKLLQDLIDFLNKPDGGRVFSSFLNAAVHDEKFDAYRRDLTMKAVQPYETVLKRAVDRKEIEIPMPLPLAIDLLIAPFVFHRISSNTPCRSSNIVPIVDFFVKACVDHKKTHPQIRATG